MTSWIVAGLALLVALAAAVCWRSAERDRRRAETERDQWATRSRHYEQQAAGYRAELAQLSAYNGRLIADNAGLTDALDAIAGEPSMTEQMIAWLGELPTTEEREYPL